MDGYKQEIRELVEKMTPTTPPEVRSERNNKPKTNISFLHLEVKEITRTLREDHTTLDKPSRR
jgi:hypothetical protein